MITDDGSGAAAELASLLQAADIAVHRIGGPDQPIDWSSPSAIDSVVERLRSQGPIAGIVHALPLAHPQGNPAAEPDWAGRIGAEVRGLFLLAKAAAVRSGIRRTAGGSCLIAATAMGGRFAIERVRHPRLLSRAPAASPAWSRRSRTNGPSIRCRVVDFSPDATTRNDRLAVGRRDLCQRRLPRSRLRGRSPYPPSFRRQPARSHAQPALELKPGEPVLISGGARGITALVAAELARTWRPTLLMVGTTPLPGEQRIGRHRRLDRRSPKSRPPCTRGFATTGTPASPAQIESTYQSLTRAREVRENLEILRKAGSTVAYAQADVRDPAALARVLDQWRARYGEPVGLIHGAGLIKDKLIRQKTIESFDRVLETKLYGALNLIRLTRPGTLKFTVLFSSIAGRFGNVGQSDYAAANEILNKLAHWLDRRSSGRVLSVIWGPWSGVGMVSQLENHLGRRGLGMISPYDGPSLLLDELRYGQKGDVEVILSGKLGTLEEPIALETAAEPLEIGS